MGSDVLGHKELTTPTVLWFLVLISLGYKLAGGDTVLDTTGQPIRFGEIFFIRAHDQSLNGITAEVFPNLDYIHLSMDNTTCTAAYFAKKNPGSKAATVKTHTPVFLTMIHSSIPDLRWWTCSTNRAYLSGNLARIEMTIVPSLEDTAILYAILTSTDIIYIQGKGGEACALEQAKSVMFSKGNKRWAFRSLDSPPTKMVFIKQ